MENQSKLHSLRDGAFLFSRDPMRNQIIQGDALAVLKTMPDNLVDCCISSPPYWGLRNYGVEGQLGLERTPQEYISRMVEVFREVMRVLKPEGTCWVNIGDSYCHDRFTSKMDGTFEGTDGMYSRKFHYMDGCSSSGPKRSGNGIKTKDLMGIPWMLAFALRDDGWYLRSDIIWAKPNPMPESVTDRPTKAHEYLFLLTKSAKYFFDQEAVREPHIRLWDERNGGSMMTEWSIKSGGAMGHRDSKNDYPLPNPSGRNIRSVWTISTQSFPEAHFATFPEALVEPCIKAGTSEKGYCPECGRPWVRVVERTGHVNKREKAHQPNNTPTKTDSTGWGPLTKGTNNWNPSCTHGLDPVPGLVLDPFMGAGTVAVVAKRLLRDYLGIELKQDYINMSLKRLAMTPAQTRLF